MRVGARQLSAASATGGGRAGARRRLADAFQEGHDAPMKMNRVLAGLAIIIALPVSAWQDAGGQRRIWLSFHLASAVVLANCEPMDSTGAATCTVTKTWKGNPGPSLIAKWHPTVRHLAPSGSSAAMFFMVRASDDIGTVRIYGESDFLAVPPHEVDILVRYLDAYVRLDSMKDPVARNVAYWQAVLEWLAVRDSFIHAEVVRDVMYRSPWGDRVPSLDLAASAALASDEPAVRAVFGGTVVQGPRDDPSDHNQAQVVRLMQGEEGFARILLRDYALNPFLRDGVIRNAIEILARGTGDESSDVSAEARRVLELLGPASDSAERKR